MRAERDELRRRDEVHKQEEERWADKLEDSNAMLKERQVVAWLTLMHSNIPISIKEVL